MYSFPQVRLGGWQQDGGTYETREVLRACVHESYGAAFNTHDVALLLLSSPSKLTPIRLPPSERRAGRQQGWAAIDRCGCCAAQLPPLLATRATPAMPCPMLSAPVVRPPAPRWPAALLQARPILRCQTGRR